MRVCREVEILFERSANRRRKRRYPLILGALWRKQFGSGAQEIKVISDSGHEMDALGHAGEEGR